jgi:hypothetical protein
MFEHSGKQIYLICGSADMRKGIDDKHQISWHRITSRGSGIFDAYNTRGTVLIAFYI